MENIVYYKDLTHYFVMTAKKDSLIKKGDIKNCSQDRENLLTPENVDRTALETYAVEAASFSTSHFSTNFYQNYQRLLSLNGKAKRMFYI